MRRQQQNQISLPQIRSKKQQQRLRKIITSQHTSPSEARSKSHRKIESYYNLYSNRLSPVSTATPLSTASSPRVKSRSIICSPASMASPNTSVRPAFNFQIPTHKKIRTKVDIQLPSQETRQEQEDLLARELKMEEICTNTEYDIQKSKSDMTEMRRDLASYEERLSQQIDIESKLKQLERISNSVEIATRKLDEADQLSLEASNAVATALSDLTLDLKKRTQPKQQKFTLELYNFTDINDWHSSVFSYDSVLQISGLD